MKIDLDAQLYRWRQIIADAGAVGIEKKAAAQLAARVLASRRLVELGGKALRGALRILPARIVRMLAGSWGRSRDVPTPPRESFSDWYRANRGKGHGGGEP